MVDNVVKSLQPQARDQDIERLLPVWNKLVNSIYDEMLKISKAEFKDIHINLREEMIFEMAKLTLYFNPIIIEARIDGRLLENIDEKEEELSCFNVQGREKIRNTAQNIYRAFWEKKYELRWKPKSARAFQKEKTPTIPILSPQDVTKNHFIPKSFIKRYWSNSGMINCFYKSSEGTITSKITPFSKWGFRKHLYSNFLEAFFSLIEGDAQKPINMLLNSIPLNHPQKQSFLAFVIINLLRNPYFKTSLQKMMQIIVENEVGSNEAHNNNYMQTVYESLFSNNDFYDKIARPIYLSHWMIAKSPNSKFLLTDSAVYSRRLPDGLLLIFPFSPSHCFISLPFRRNSEQVIPESIILDQQTESIIASLLVHHSHESFLASHTFNSDNISKYSEEFPSQIVDSLKT